MPTSASMQQNETHLQMFIVDCSEVVTFITKAFDKMLKYHLVKQPLRKKPRIIKII